jgi:chromosome segregation ATPase
MDVGAAVGELTKANKKLELNEKKLESAEAKLAAAEAATPSAPERIAKAELGVAEAKLGVAEAKWESAGEGAIKDTLKKSVDAAQESVRLAQKAYEKLLDAAQGEQSPKPHSQKVEPFCAGSAN